MVPACSQAVIVQPSSVPTSLWCSLHHQASSSVLQCGHAASNQHQWFSKGKRSHCLRKKSFNSGGQLGGQHICFSTRMTASMRCCRDQGTPSFQVSSAGSTAWLELNMAKSNFDVLFWPEFGYFSSLSLIGKKEMLDTPILQKSCFFYSSGAQCWITISGWISLS